MDGRRCGEEGGEGCAGPAERADEREVEGGRGGEERAGGGDERGRGCGGVAEEVRGPFGGVG